MVQGLNTNVEHEGTCFHVQTEDLGPRRAKIQTLVFRSGDVVAVVDDSYAKLDLDDAALTRRLTDQHKRVVSSLRGKGLPADPPGAAQVARAPARRADRPTAASAVAPGRSRRRAGGGAWLALSVAAASWVVMGLTVSTERGPAGAWDTGAALGPRARARAAEPVMLDNAQPVAERMASPANATAGEPLPVASAAPAQQLAEPRTRATPEDPRRAPVEAESVEPLPARAESPPVARVAPPGAAHQALPATKPAPEMPAAVAGAAPRSPPQVARPAPPAPPVSEAVPREPPPVTQSMPPQPPASPRRDAPLPEPRLPEVFPGQLVALDAVDVLPRATKRDLPGYTRRAKRRNEQGRVGLDLLIDEQGRVAQLRFREQVPDSDLNDAVVEAARSWLFVPARKSGMPVRVWKPVALEFSIAAGQTHVRYSE